MSSTKPFETEALSLLCSAWHEGYIAAQRKAGRRSAKCPYPEDSPSASAWYWGRFSGARGAPAGQAWARAKDRLWDAGTTKRLAFLLQCRKHQIDPCVGPRYNSPEWHEALYPSKLVPLITEPFVSKP